jgi:hypothetical protein
MGLCGDNCKGYYFSTHYAAAGAKGATKAFIDEYKAAYGKTPDDVAALTWDAGTDGPGHQGTPADCPATSRPTAPRSRTPWQRSRTTPASPAE